MQLFQIDRATFNRSLALFIRQNETRKSNNVGIRLKDNHAQGKLWENNRMARVQFCASAWIRLVQLFH
jgi:hypothetical protein